MHASGIYLILCILEVKQTIAIQYLNIIAHLSTFDYLYPPRRQQLSNFYGGILYTNVYGIN